MKILFVSMPSIHFIRWIDNLKDQNWELFWFDILDRGKLQTELGIRQYTGWKTRKIPYIKGEYSLRKKIPILYQKLRILLEVTEAEKFELILNQIKPDIVHSFEMQECSYPLLNVLNKKKYSHIKWIYSCWGSDLYYYRNFKKQTIKITKTLKRIDYLHADNERDKKIAKELGFKGKSFGTYPGGGGYNIPSKGKFFNANRNLILVKGYQHKFGRGLTIIRALEEILPKISERGYKVIVFGAHNEVLRYIADKSLPFESFSRHALIQEDVLRIMQKTSIYIGNSISDGMANTMIEAIISGAFPIQSNPGGVSEEIIEDGKNGFLINDPTSIESIKFLVTRILEDRGLLYRAFKINYDLAKNRFDYNLVKNQIIQSYNNL
ncbi:glycosyltransferase [Zunongwangia sp.]|uniref:glycosyltransferase n=1 Tax=Zunongwangia sp. TaxID=1965325 RepID=UPI003AA7D4EC